VKNETFLTSKFHHVAHDIAGKLSDEQKQKVVFITTPFKYRVFKDSELAWHYNNLEAMQKHAYHYDFMTLLAKQVMISSET
jgi:hypothetical protein